MSAGLHVGDQRHGWRYTPGSTHDSWGQGLDIDDDMEPIWNDAVAVAGWRPWSPNATKFPTGGRLDPCWSVYELLNAAGDVIYVGMTGNVKTRIRFHRTNQPWRAEIAGHRIVSRHEYKGLAAEAEQRRIRELCPRHNVRHNPALDVAA